MIDFFEGSYSTQHPMKQRNYDPDEFFAPRVREQDYATPLSQVPGGTMGTAAMAPLAGFRGIDDYAAYLNAQRAANAPLPQNPIGADFAAVRHPTIQGDAFMSPFGQEDRPYSGQEIAMFREQMELLHRPRPEDQIAQYKQKRIAQEAGVSFAPRPMSALLTNRVDGNDDALMNHAELMTPEDKAQYQQDRMTIRKAFAAMSTRNSGQVDFQDMVDRGDELARQYPLQDGFIRDTIQNAVLQNPAMKAQYAQWKDNLGREGNQVFQGMQEGQQAELKQMIRMAEGGNVFPELAKAVGFEVSDYGITRAGDMMKTPVTPEEVAAAARAFYGLERQTAEQPSIVGGISDGRRQLAQGGKQPRQKQLLLSNGVTVSTGPTNEAAGFINVGELVQKLLASKDPKSAERAKRIIALFQDVAMPGGTMTPAQFAATLPMSTSKQTTTAKPRSGRSRASGLGLKTTP